MRYVRILALHFEHILEHRARSFVWFLVSLFNPFVFMIFWVGAFSGKSQIGLWTLSGVTSYYFLLTVAGSTLMAHIEEDVSRQDIKEGGLVNYLLKPFSYYWIKFSEEIHYRLLQGFYGVIVILLATLIFGRFIHITSDPLILVLSLVVAIFAYFLSFTFKMIIGMVAFWMSDIWGFYSVVDVVLMIFAGFVMPIELFNSTLTHISYALPFAYMIYFPVIAFLGKLTVLDFLRVIGMQMMWLFILFFLYRFVWRRGIKQFTGSGQ